MSVGTAFQGAGFSIVREDDTEAPPGEIGEIVHRGVGTMPGYVGDEPATKTKLRDDPLSNGPTPPTVVFTGDRGYIDEDGYLYVVGRKDRMIKVRGNRVYPEEIEEVLSSVDGVIRAAAVQIHIDDQSVLAAAVQTNCPDTSPVKIRRSLSTQLPNYMIPDKVEVFEKLPTTPSGKTDLPAVASMLRERL